LLAIPAIHFNHLFAGAVNRMCRNADTRPDAIAVELGPQAAQEVRSWLGELGAGPKVRKKLSVMLGLTRRNRVIRASMREKAFQLQRETGMDLSELPPEILHRELGFAGSVVLYLSPTDSIIEAIRCSVELDLPLYGVDLEESASGNYRQIVIRDPIGAGGDLTSYILENAAYSARSGDHEVDGRREVAMAARLKSILTRYRRVLFTCGMGHWFRIRQLMDDPAIRPAVLPELSHEGNGYNRVVVHPLVAVYHMDLFPKLVQAYERTRKHPRLEETGESRHSGPDPGRLFSNLLNKAYATYFREEKAGLARRRQGQDLLSLPAFEGHLINLSLCGHRSVPDLFTTLKAAQQTMSRDFLQVLAKTLMDFSWASPDRFPGCAFLAPAAGGVPGRARCGGEDAEDGDHFFIQPLPGSSPYGVEMTIPYEWEKDRKVRYLRQHDYLLHTWPPWDCLISSMSARAIGRVRTGRNQTAVQPFEGSLLGGIDLKATVRAHSRGREDVLVRDSRAKKSARLSHWRDGFPVVWILEPGDHPEARWTALYEECKWMKRYVKDPGRLDQFRERIGRKMIALVAYGDLRIKTGASDLNPEVRSDRLHGITLYQPIPWSARQFARWAESTNYRRNPYSHSNTLSQCVTGGLTGLFREKHGVTIGEHHWTTTLVLMAIPFARNIVTVVVPDGYQIEPSVFAMAQRSRVEVCRVPLSMFSQPELERLSLNYMAPAIVRKPRCVFSESIEQAIGESQTDNRDMVPEAILEFGNFP
jgi:hypothetical protein